LPKDPRLSQVKGTASFERERTPECEFRNKEIEGRRAKESIIIWKRRRG